MSDPVTLSTADATLLFLQQCRSMDPDRRDACMQAVIAQQITPEIEQEIVAAFEREIEDIDEEIAVTQGVLETVKERRAEAVAEEDALLAARAAAHMAEIDTAVADVQTEIVRAEKDVDSYVETEARSTEGAEMDAIRNMLNPKKDAGAQAA
jgi:hypothetical protein